VLRRSRSATETETEAAVQTEVKTATSTMLAGFVLIAGTVHKRGGKPVGTDPEGVYEMNAAARKHYLEGLRASIPSIAHPGGTAVLGDRATFER